jgi:hypothetical protein
MSNGCNYLGFFYGRFQRLPYCCRHHEKMLSQKMFLNLLKWSQDGYMLSNP